MRHAPPSLRSFRIAGLLAWGAAGLSLVRPFLASSAPRPGAPLAVGAVALLAFGGAFLAMTSEARVGRPRRGSVTFLAVETAAALLFAFLVGPAAAGILLVVVTSQLPFCLPPRTTFLWTAGQNVVYALLALARSGLAAGAAVVAAFLAFQLFALYTVALAEREAHQRAELARLNTELLSAQELLADRSRIAERLRIARDLHDALGHHLAALSLQLEVAREVAEGRARAPVEKARALARQLLSDVRDAVGAFREEGRVDVAEALRVLASDIPRPRIHLDLGDGPLAADPAVTATLLRSVQEVVTNSVKHSGAENLWITVTRSTDALEVRARDDGAGAGRFTDGHGLKGLAERIALANGSLDITTAPGRGFEVAIRIPSLPAGPA